MSTLQRGNNGMPVTWGLRGAQLLLVHYFFHSSRLGTVKAPSDSMGTVDAIISIPRHIYGGDHFRI